VQVLWDYNTGKVKVFNSTLTGYTNLTASAAVYDIPDLTPKYTNQVTLDVPADLPTDAFTIPAIDGLSTTYFVRLRLKDPSGGLIGDNLYWYSTQPDVLDYDKSDWYITPVTRYADLTGLNHLPANNNVTASATTTTNGGNDITTITLANADKTNVAFFVHVEIVDAGGNEILPVIWSDNYLTLWPGETTTITAKYAAENSSGQPVRVRVKGFNVPEFSVDSAVHWQTEGH
jgi:exo-1,4-beta-D-glucosaminidase